eukprot:TRINITY_DN31357_c0_g1_i1.p2 TRINITY_DN31357_c0_g1~~TRINITY_DN31357_c0_g1_i1.p2  ORF type:complete len:113 (+),score=22.99 TRINITY_DN31357_c0_g1_i1:281-619(+)
MLLFLSVCCLISFCSLRKLTGVNSMPFQKIRGAINRRSLQQSEAHIIEEEDEEDEDEAAEGEQDNVSNRLTRLENEVHALNDNINSLNTNITARFTFMDESLAAILARLGHQ